MIQTIPRSGIGKSLGSQYRHRGFIVRQWVKLQKTKVLTLRFLVVFVAWVVLLSLMKLCC